VKVVARVAIPFEMMEQLVAAVSINYDNFKKSSRK
jgi:hypothetical protein